MKPPELDIDYRGISTLYTPAPFNFFALTFITYKNKDCATVGLGME